MANASASVLAQAVRNSGGTIRCAIGQARFVGEVGGVQRRAVQKKGAAAPVV